MNPAYQIPLSPRELQCLGELTAIIGQVDEDITRTVSGLISADRPTANLVLGSSKVADNSNIWAALIGLRSKDEDILWLVEHAIKEITEVSKGRNDFVHAFFQHGSVLSISVVEVEDGHAVVYGETEPVTARRVRNNKRRPIAELFDVRDRAARLSCLIAHIGWCMAPHGRDHPEHSPWLERLGPTLPTRLDTVEARRAKAQQPRQRPSRRSRQTPPPEAAGE